MENNTAPLIRKVYETYQNENPIGEVLERNPIVGGGDWNRTKTTIVSSLYPAGQNIIGYVTDMSKEDSLDVLEKAKTAWDKGHGERPRMLRELRIAKMNKFVQKLLTKREVIVDLLMKEICKNETDAQAEFDRTIAYIEDTIKVYADDKVFGNFKEQSKGYTAMNEHMPLGVTLCVAPFNYPFNETCTTMIPALLTGNPIILKPAKHGVLFRSYLQSLMQECFPEGVANIVTWDGPTVLGSIMSTGDVDVLAFIGSEGAANAIAKNHPKQNRLEQVLGLGAKDPIVITKTTDIQRYIKEIVKSVFGFNGQRCTAGKQLFVDKDRYVAFMKAFLDEVENLMIGMPTGPKFNVKDLTMIDDGAGADITPLAEWAKKIAYINELKEDALSKGASIVNAYGGECFEALMVPIVLTDIREDMRLFWEEQFAPIIGVYKYDSLDEVIDRMDRSPYAQQSALYGDKDSLDMQYLREYSKRVYARTNVNSPCMRGPDDFSFAARKNSGKKPLSIRQALEAFTLRVSEVEKV